MEITSLTYGLEFLDRMVKAAKINIINANVRNAQTGDYYYNPYKIVNKTFTDTDGKQVTLKIGITGVLPTQILVWDKANLEGKVTSTIQWRLLRLLFLK